MFHSYKIEGVVIKRINLGEADKILTIFTKEKGKIVVLAKGIRKIHSRKAPHLEPFSYVKAFVSNGKTFDLITEVETIENFSLIRLSLKRIAYGYQVAEVIDRLCAEREQSKSVFNLLVDFFKKMNQKEETNYEFLLDEFFSRLLWELGFLPRGKLLSGVALDNYLEKIMERNLKSKSLLSKLLNF